MVDELDPYEIKALPNLDYKIVCGNSLLGVEKDLFNAEAFAQLERLKPLLFNETDATKKLEYKQQIDRIIKKLTHDDEHFDFEVYFSEVFHEKGGFDVAIANPPYVGEKGHKEMFRELKKGILKKYYKRKMDLFYFFFHLALDIGKTDCHIAFITTNYYLTSMGGKILREDFKKRSNIKNLINFNELKIFESALGQHNIITILHKGIGNAKIAQNCITRRTGIATPEILQNILSKHDSETDYYYVNQKDLYDGEESYIRLTGTASGDDSSEIQKILMKIKNQNELLGVICNVNQGILTGVDKITEKHILKYPNLSLIKGSGVYVLSETEVQSISKINDVIKPWFKNSDINRYFTKQKNNEWLIYATRDISFNIDSPIYKHLLKYEKVIKNRNMDRGEMQAALKVGKWWVVFAVRKDINFEGPKIIAPQRSSINTFGYNEIPWYAASDVFFITSKEKYKNISLKYILALINSNLYYLWLYYKGKRKGEALELIAKPLSEIPIKNVSYIKQKPFIALVDKILAITDDADYLTTPAKQAKVQDYERQIDRLVYQLYDLTPAEIAIVEGRK